MFAVPIAGYLAGMTAPSNPSLADARHAAESGELAEWVRDFLGTDGSDNEVLGQQLFEEKSSWLGPVELDFDHLHRLAGPADQPTLERLTDEDIDTVEGMAESVEEGWEPPPLIVSIDDKAQLLVEDGNHRTEGLRRAGHQQYWSIVGFDDEAQRTAFVELR